ncbi:MAG: phosphatidate cytidylyltransferase, partial [Pseudomonadota bacterium]
LAIFLLPPNVFTLVLALILLGIGGWESASLAGLNHRAGRIGWIVFLLIAGALLIGLLHIPIAVPLLFGLATLGWCILLLWLRHIDWGQADADRLQIRKLIIGGLILLPAFAAISWLQFSSPWLVLAVILVIAAADIGAFFTGRQFGGPKLARQISPGKTWSGAIGGIFLAALVFVLTFWLIPQMPLNITPTHLLTLTIAGIAGALLALLSIGGDLTISLMKRQRGMKDTSSLLPGHGGLLDRFDSLAAATPAFALMIWWAIKAEDAIICLSSGC